MISVKRSDGPAFALRIQISSHAFDRRKVLDDLTIEIRSPEPGGPADCLCLLGPNGAGKSTLLKLINGRLQAGTGSFVEVDGRDLKDLPPEARSRFGVASVNEVTGVVVPELSVLSNLMLIPSLAGTSWLGRLAWPGRRAARIRESSERLHHLASRHGCEELLKWLGRPAGSLSYGWRKVVGFLRVALAEPRLVLLDEPFAGLDPAKADTLLGMLRDWRLEGRLVVFAEHIRNALMRQSIQQSATRLVVLRSGRIALDGRPVEVLDDPRFLEIYSGAAREPVGSTLTSTSTQMGRDEVALDYRKLRAGYGGPSVLEVDRLTISRGRLTLLVGPNGSGKSTLIGSLQGIGCSVRGSIQVFGKSVVGDPPHRLARAGVAVVPQTARVFSGLTVERNVAVAASTLVGLSRSGAWGRVVRSFPSLAARRRQLAGSLSGGEQAQLALALALVREPILILADELSIGLDARSSGDLLRRLSGRVAEGLTVVLAEQTYAGILPVADRVLALRDGGLVWDSIPEAFNQVVQDALFSGRMLPPAWINSIWPVGEISTHPSDADPPM